MNEYLGFRIADFELRIGDDGVWIWELPSVLIDVEGMPEGEEVRVGDSLIRGTGTSRRFRASRLSRKSFAKRTRMGKRRLPSTVVEMFSPPMAVSTTSSTSPTLIP